MKWLLPLCVLMAACTASPDSLTGPSGAASGLQRSVADNPPTGTPGTSCSSVVPSNFRVQSGELVGDRWKNLVEFTPIVNVTSYLLEYQKRGGSLHVMTLTGRTTYEVYDFGQGIFSGRLRGNCGGATWTKIVEWSNGEGSLNGPPNAPPVIEED